MYVKFKGDRVQDVKTALEGDERLDRAWTERWNWTSFEIVQTIASYLTAMKGTLWVPVDRGPGVSPRYDVVQVPKVGDEVSYGFNGDSYPCSVVTKVSKSLTVTTSEGNTFRRRKQTASWVRTGGTWSLIRGHHYEQNPHI